MPETMAPLAGEVMLVGAVAAVGLELTFFFAAAATSIGCAARSIDIATRTKRKLARDLAIDRTRRLMGRTPFSLTRAPDRLPPLRVRRTTKIVSRVYLPDDFSHQQVRINSTI